MKRISTLLLLSLTMGGTVFAKQVDEQTATIVAKNFIATKMSGTEKQKLEVRQITGRSNVDGSLAFNTYYVFDLNNKHGFVVVSADDIVKPILAYSTSEEFQTGFNLSPETKYWMGLYHSQIEFAVLHNLTATPEAIADWNYYTATTGHTANKPTNSVSPMLNTNWNQGTYYNIYTPGTGSTKTPVGCVATAMAQIMKYWNAPTTGTGSYSYNHPTYGTQSANFGTTNYQWGLMPVSLSSASSQAAKNAVSLLGYHCAVSVKMDFAPEGSGSQVLAWNASARCAENAFKNNFGYKTSIDGLYRDDYNDNDWDALLKNELDNARPILYAGFGASGGHAFVFDGYDDNGLFHINWGWGGMSNGYFTVDNLAPSALGIGGGGGNFNNNQQALIKIEPASPSDTLNIVMNTALSISNTTINKGAPFSITAGVLNRGTLDYGGVFTMGIYRSADSSFASYMPYITNQVVLGGNDTTYTFSTPGIATLAAGDYFARALFRAEGANAWSPLPDDMGFTNRINLTVVDNGATGIGQAILEQSFAVFPNPANTKLTIGRKGFAGRVDALQLYNLQGQRIRNITGIDSQSATVSVNDLSSGIYYLHIVTDQGIATKKIVVQH